MAQATLRYCTHKRTGVTAWHFGVDQTIDGDVEHTEGRLADAAEIPAWLVLYGLGKQSVDVIEAEPAADVDDVMAALGRAAKTLGRYAEPKFTAILEG